MDIKKVDVFTYSPQKGIKIKVGRLYTKDMTELDILKQDLIKLEIEMGVKQPKFWLGLGFIIAGLMVVISFILV